MATVLSCQCVCQLGTPVGPGLCGHDDRLLADPAHGAADPGRPGLGGHQRGTGRLAPVRGRGRVAVVGAVGLFAGPARAWAVVGVGLFIVLLGSAVAIVWQQRRSVVWP